jgi:hypothetical protein
VVPGTVAADVERTFALVGHVVPPLAFKASDRFLLYSFNMAFLVTNNDAV